MKRGVVSGPLEAAYAGHFSAPLAELYQPSKLRRRTAALVKYMRTLSGPLQKTLMRKMANALENTHWSLFVPMKLFVMWEGSKEDDAAMQVSLPPTTHPEILSAFTICLVQR
jgi:hypothetical protein